MRRPVLPLLAAATALAAAAGLSPSNAAPSLRAIDDYAYGFQGEGTARIGDKDLRRGSVAPTARQRELARELGAPKARFNRFGTPHMLINHDGYLTGPADGKPADVARAFVQDNAELFRLSANDLRPDRLELIADNPLYESTDRRRMMFGEKPRNTDVAHVVLFRQRFGDLPAAGSDGLLTVGVDKDGRVAIVTSSVTGVTTVTNERRLSAFDAYVKAAADVGRTVALPDLTLVDAKDHAGFTTFTVKGTGDLQRARLVALPTPVDGVRAVWETVVLKAHPDEHGHPEAYIHFVDAETGRVLLRQNRVEHLGAGVPAVLPQTAATPTWQVFEANPPFPVPGTQTPDARVTWCWVLDTSCHRLTGPVTGSLREIATPNPYDVTYTENGQPVVTFTTKGNNAETAGSYFSHLTPDIPQSPVAADRQYNFPFTDQWHTSSCSPANFVSPQRNDLDAATVNLFTMHNRMHDWGYFLGWTESTWNMQRHNFGEDHPNSATAKDNDPETGQAQAGAVSGGVAFLGRDNANQITLQDGVPGVTNQYLWHPLQAGFYSACVDGAYDMSVVGHEVGHAIQNRMTAGPDGNLSGHQAQAMGESWSDLTAIEYLNGYGFVPIAGEDPYAVGPYATASMYRGIRNYNMSDSPLNYSDVDYDGNGTTSPHADGEIWSATQFDLRQAFIDEWQKKYPYENETLQYSCADGLLDAKDCPGNRRWVQIMHDAFLTQPGQSAMIDARDAQLGADKLRFAGKHQKLMWDVYAKRGLGEEAESNGPGDREPVPGFSSPERNDEPSVTFVAKPVDGGGVPEELNVYVGHYEARITPVATSAAGKPSEPVKFVPGTYEFVAAGAGYGHIRFTRTFAPGRPVTVEIPVRRNHASATHEAEATGDGGNFQFVNDDTEGTNWAYIGESDTETSIVGKQFTIALAGGRQLVAEINVSTANRPALCDGATGDDPFEVVQCDDDDEAPYDPGPQNRFAALRAFEILACDESTGGDCESDDGFTVIYESPEDAFATGRPRPLAPDLKLKTFDVPDTYATHVRLRVVTNQCVGNPLYSAEENPSTDPTSNPDCEEGYVSAALTGTSQSSRPTIFNTQRHKVRVAELQVFSKTAAEVLAAGSTAPPPVNPPPVNPPPKVNPPKRPSTLPSTGFGISLLPAALMLTVAVALRRSRRTT